MTKKFIEKIMTLSVDEQREEVAKKLKQTETNYEFLKKLSRVLANPKGRLKLEDWYRPDLDKMK